MKQVRKNNSATMVLMLEALRESPRTVVELSELSGLGLQPVRFWLASLRDASIARVVDYTHDTRGRRIIPMWGLGGGVDAERPGHRPGAAAQRMARMRERRRAGG